MAGIPSQSRIRPFQPHAPSPPCDARPEPRQNQEPTREGGCWGSPRTPTQPRVRSSADGQRAATGFARSPHAASPGDSVRHFCRDPQDFCTAERLLRCPPAQDHPSANTGTRPQTLPLLNAQENVIKRQTRGTTRSASVGSSR